MKVRDVEGQRSLLTRFLWQMSGIYLTELIKCRAMCGMEVKVFSTTEHITLLP